MSTPAPAPPLPGQVVKVRSRQYLVGGVVPAPNIGDQTLVRLSCLDDDAQGAHLEVLWEKEVDAQVLDDAVWAQVGQKGFDPPRLFSAYLNTLRWNSVTATDPKLFQAPWRAGIGVKAYQLEPLRKALLLPRVNLFITASLPGARVLSPSRKIPLWTRATRADASDLLSSFQLACQRRVSGCAQLLRSPVQASMARPVYSRSADWVADEVLEMENATPGLERLSAESGYLRSTWEHVIKELAALDELR
jgi:hypothetical protein